MMKQHTYHQGASLSHSRPPLDHLGHPLRQISMIDVVLVLSIYTGFSS